MSEPASIRCPICKKPVADPGDGPIKPPFPFCSERCKLIDLGRWLDGAYQIPVVDPDVEEDAPSEEE